MQPMAGPRISDGAPAPLFDRLIDDEPQVSREVRVRNMLGPVGLRDSIRAEIMRLIDTRRAISVEAALAEPGPLTVLDYGIADITSLMPDNIDDRRLIRLALEKAIAAFEPRLARPNVQVELRSGHPGCLRLEITGMMRVGNVMEPVAFPIDLGPQRTIQAASHGE